jgi:hypothetical protein
MSEASGAGQDQDRLPLNSSEHFGGFVLGRLIVYVNHLRKRHKSGVEVPYLAVYPILLRWCLKKCIGRNAFSFGNITNISFRSLTFTHVASIAILMINVEFGVSYSFEGINTV